MIFQSACWRLLVGSYFHVGNFNKGLSTTSWTKLLNAIPLNDRHSETTIHRSADVSPRQRWSALIGININVDRTPAFVLLFLRSKVSMLVFSDPKTSGQEWHQPDDRDHDRKPSRAPPTRYMDHVVIARLTIWKEIEWGPERTNGNRARCSWKGCLLLFSVENLNLTTVKQETWNLGFANLSIVTVKSRKIYLCWWLVYYNYFVLRGHKTIQTIQRTWRCNRSIWVVAPARSK